MRVLDVGPAYQTALFRAMWDGLVVDTLGFGDVRFAPRDGERHFHVDLNETVGAEVVEGGHDMVVVAEVIEHLYTAGRRSRTGHRWSLAAARHEIGPAAAIPRGGCRASPDRAPDR